MYKQSILFFTLCTLSLVSHARQPPQAAINACEGASDRASCSFSGRHGTVSGYCSSPPGKAKRHLVCMPSSRAGTKQRKNDLSPSTSTENQSKQYRYITSNGLPNHSTGQFPNRHNPHRIESQSYSFRINLTPQQSGRIIVLSNRQYFGVAINGVVFDPGTAEYWNRDRQSGWREEALYEGAKLGLDNNNAHVQPNGAYHYHGMPEAINTSAKQKLLGYAADGFPIYNDIDPKTLTRLRASYRVKQGVRPSGPGGRYTGKYVQDYEYRAGIGDLDECNGRSGQTAEYPDGTYYYVITDSYPSIPRCFKGIPDSSFNKRR